MTMRRPPRPQPLAQSSVLNTTANPFASLLNEEDGLSEKRISAKDIGVSDDDYSSADESSPRGRQKPPRPSMAATSHRAALTASAKRRRRRSSARFLQLGGRRDGSMDGGVDGDESQNNTKTHSEGNLSELYQKAIRMNAENKINAVNSWNLRLIENIDKFLNMDEDETSPTTPIVNSSNMDASMSTKRVNFTKASCTLDASVKIYSYRVDDVHLTSYKVLANLNRTDTQKPVKATGSNEASAEEDDSPTQKRTISNKRIGSTLETQVANINLNRLDSAFDIDPLFHKMSKTFDEGGAKGLLLANLGVGQNGCNIVFDSSHDDNGVEETSSKTSNFTSPRLTEGMMDVTSLTAKLESLLQEQEEQNIGAQSLVPQLSTLRAEHDALEAGGFVENGAVALAATVGPKTPGKRLYHANANEEREADYSIHKEAMERSRLSAGQNLSTRFLDSPSDYTKQDDDDDLVDFGGGYDDGDDDDGVDAFIATSGYRYSDVSFPLSETKNAVTSTKPDIATTYTANLIDAIASGQTVLSCNDYEYFNKACETNYWAGSAHWKRAARTRKDAVQSTKKANTKTPKKPIKTKERVMVLLMRAPNLSQLFATKGRSKHRSTQLSKAMIEKHTNQENLLPEDAGFEVEQLTKLFLRPNAVLKTQNTRIREESGEAIKSPNGVGKSVGFDVPDWDDGSYGDINDDGGGFDFGADDHGDEDDEFLVQELEGVRKVEKIRVGCAAVAKKVDVKRLKRDLWAELESKFAHSNNDDDMKYGKGSEETASTEQDVVSFHDAVRELDLQKSQVDATLPFYFICILHLANEKGLRLEQEGLEDFTIHPPDSDIALVPF